MGYKKQKRPWNRNAFIKLLFAEKLRKMLVYKLCHFKHRNSSLSSEYFLKIRISVNVTSFFCILKLVLFNVFPKFFYYFSAWHRLAANNRLKSITYIHGFHESGIWFSFYFWFCSSFLFRSRFFCCFFRSCFFCFFCHSLIEFLICLRGKLTVNNPAQKNVK